MLLLAFIAVVTALCILGHGWPPHRSGDAPAGSCRPGRGRAARPSNRTARRHRPWPGSPRPRADQTPCADLRVHESAAATFPPWRAGYPVTPGRRRARYDAGDTGTALTRGLARVPSCHQARTTLARAYGGRCDASHGKGPGQGIIPGLDLDVAGLALMPQPPATLSRRW